MADALSAGLDRLEKPEGITEKDIVIIKTGKGAG